MILFLKKLKQETTQFCSLIPKAFTMFADELEKQVAHLDMLSDLDKIENYTEHPIFIRAMKITEAHKIEAPDKLSEAYEICCGYDYYRDNVDTRINPYSVKGL